MTVLWKTAEGKWTAEPYDRQFARGGWVVVPKGAERLVVLLCAAGRGGPNDVAIFQSAKLVKLYSAASRRTAGGVTFGCKRGMLQCRVNTRGRLTEVESLIHRFTTGRAWFLEQCQTYDPHLALGEGEWSLAQVIEHLVLTERGMLAGMMRAKTPMPPSTPERDQRVARYIALLESGERYEVPSELVEPTEEPDLDTVLADWEKVRGRFSALLEKGVPGPEIQAIEHPIAGPLNAGETFEFLASHLVYHRKRVEPMLENLARS